MLQGIQEPVFWDGFAVGELTGRLKHQAPKQIKEWISLSRLNDIKGTLRKYNYTITGVTAHPSNPSQVLMIAEKTAGGTNPNLVQAFTQSDRFMDGWEAGCLYSQLRYEQPVQIEQWVKINNLDAIQQVLDQHGYTITSMRIHPQDKRWTMLNARKG
ncbi:MAG: hypothetical protein K6T90_11615 [Leptolyngbyaceae cyanobacterium HOT.MB2.61]|jgi:hypothetical protein|nr:hypothetical protein [Leptolyngbyaceae cyanobacterium HOT.MB2.61]